MGKMVAYSTNIHIWEASVAYRREVEKVLDLMRSTESGKALIECIDLRVASIIIVPFKPTKSDPVNAYAQPLARENALPKGVVAEVTTYDLTRFGLGKVQIPTKLGTGKGSAVRVAYHPATWNQVIKNAKGYVAPGTGPAEVLFHELVHAYRMQSGVLSDDPVPGAARFDDVDEFCAILAANVYRSERGFKQLRADHWTNLVLVPELSTSEAYYKKTKRIIDDWYARQRQFCDRMAAVPALFNPFREAAYALGYLKEEWVRVRA